MSAIPIRDILKSKGLGIEATAKKLFPKTGHSYLAFRRVLDGRGDLKEPQILKLAELTGMSVCELYGGLVWSTKMAKDLIVFNSGDFEVKLHTDLWKAEVFEKDTLFHEILLGNNTITITAFLKHINEIIKNR